MGWAIFERLRFWIYTGRLHNKFLYLCFVGRSMRRRRVISTGVVLGVAGCLGFDDSNYRYEDLPAGMLLPELSEEFTSQDYFDRSETGDEFTAMYTCNNEENMLVFDLFVTKTEQEALSIVERYVDDFDNVDDTSFEGVDSVSVGTTDRFAQFIIQDSNAVGVVNASQEGDGLFIPDRELAYEKTELMVNHWNSLDP